MSYNYATLIGRLVRVPELKKTENGRFVMSNTIAVNRRFNRDVSDFIDFVTWGKTAEFTSRHFTKGDPIGISGEIHTRKYEDKNGVSRTAFEIVAEQVFFVGTKKDSNQAEKNDTQSFNSVSDDFAPIDIDEELPF